MAAKVKRKKDGKPGTVNDATDEDAGYTAEIRLPRYGIGAPTAGRTWFPMVDDEGKPFPRRG